MKRRRFRHYPPAVEDHTGVPRETETATILNSSVATQLDVCRCPKCEAPMTARNGPAGPYFHCQCATPKKTRPSVRWPVVAQAKAVPAEGATLDGLLVT